jgi:hypothetical protein
MLAIAEGFQEWNDGERDWLASTCCGPPETDRESVGFK